MHRLLSLTSIGILLLIPRAAWAQWPTAASPLDLPPILQAASPDRPQPIRAWPAQASDASRSYAIEGAILGGVAFGFLGAITGVGLCHFDDPCPHPVPFAIGGFVLGAMVGVGIGGRLGAWIPKYRSY